MTDNAIHLITTDSDPSEGTDDPATTALVYTHADTKATLTGFVWNAAYTMVFLSTSRHQIVSVLLSNSQVRIVFDTNPKWVWKATWNADLRQQQDRFLKCLEGG
jgi:hypothetical protein